MANQAQRQGPAFKNIFFFMAIVMLLYVINSVTQQGSDKVEIEFSQFMEEVVDQKINDVKIKGQQIEGTYNGEGGQFMTVGPINDEGLRKELEKAGVKVNYAAA